MNAISGAENKGQSTLPLIITTYFARLLLLDQITLGKSRDGR